MRKFFQISPNYIVCSVLQFLTLKSNNSNQSFDHNEKGVSKWNKIFLLATLLTLTLILGLYVWLSSGDLANYLMLIDCTSLLVIMMAIAHSYQSTSKAKQIFVIIEKIIKKFQGDLKFNFEHVIHASKIKHFMIKSAIVLSLYILSLIFATFFFNATRIKYLIILVYVSAMVVIIISRFAFHMGLVSMILDDSWHYEKIFQYNSWEPNLCQYEQRSGNIEVSKFKSFGWKLQHFEWNLWTLLGNDNVSKWNQRIIHGDYIIVLSSLHCNLRLHHLYVCIEQISFWHGRYRYEHLNRIEFKNIISPFPDAVLSFLYCWCNLFLIFYNSEVAYENVSRHHKFQKKLS